MEEKRRHHIRFDDGRVAGVFDDDGNFIMDVDKVIIRADDIVVIKNEDDKHHHGDRDRIGGERDRRDHDRVGGERDHKRSPFWF